MAAHGAREEDPMVKFPRTTVIVNGQRWTAAQANGRRAVPRPTQFTPSAAMAAQATEGRTLRVEAQRTLEVAPKEFVRVSCTLAACCPVDGDRDDQFTLLAAQAALVVDAQIARFVTKNGGDRSDPHAVVLPPTYTAVRVGITFGGTFKVRAGDPDCFEFFRAEVGVDEPVADGADIGAVSLACQEWAGTQVRAQIVAQRAKMGAADETRRALASLARRNQK
jgi:hypothetical protein